MDKNAIRAILKSVDKQENKPKPKKQVKAKAEVKETKPEAKETADVKKQTKAKAEVKETKSEAKETANVNPESNKDVLLKLQKKKHTENRDSKTKLFSFSLTTDSRKKLRKISKRLGMSSSQFIEYVCENNEKFTLPKNKRKKPEKALVSLTLSHKSHKWLKKASNQHNYNSLSAFLDDFLTRELPEIKEIPPKR